jgi:Tol biopolymer transport system component/C-terminal processing protease CtpA/Prc
MRIASAAKHLVFIAAASFAVAGAAQAAPSLSEPSLSPDGQEIAFVSGGDIWSVPSSGGVARLLVSDPATESRPLWSPDGKTLAFVSNRGGASNIYLLALATGEVKRLTFADSGESLDAWSRDGRWIYFSSGVNDVGRQPDVFRVSAEGGTPLEVSRERYLAEFQSAPSPDGKTLALMARGLSAAQWWRNGHAHIDETELWLKTIDAPGGYRKLVEGGAKHAFPMWSPDGASISYMSDESGAENLWRIPVAGGAPTQLTHFTSGRLLWPSIAYDGASIVFERGFGVWRWDASTGQSRQVPIQLRGAPSSEGERHLTETMFREIALSPDGKKVALIAHGEVFAASAKDGGSAQRVTRTAAAESELLWAPDSRRLAFLAEEGLEVVLKQYDFGTSRTTTLSKGPAPVRSAAYAPDGKSIAYVAGEDALRVVALKADGAPISERTIFTGALEGRDAAPVWSPDGRWLAFGVTGPKAFRNIYVAPAAGGEARPVSFLANGATGSRIAWSPDGTYLLIATAQRSEDVRLVRIDLLPHVPKYREDAFQELFKSQDQPDKPASPSQPAPQPGPLPATATDAKHAAEDGPGAGEDKGAAAEADGKKKAVKPVRIVFEGIRERATTLPLGMSAEEPVISPDGKTLVFRARQGEHEALYTYSLDELAHEPPSPHELAAGDKAKGDYAFTPDSKMLFYRDGGRIFSSPVEGPKPTVLAATAELDVDFTREKRVVFDEAWSALQRGFFDANFNGKDWSALYASFLPQVEGARTGDELRRVINLMIGELNASHSGINKAPEPAEAARRAHAADLGLRFDRTAYEAGRGLVVREIIALGPVDLAGGVHTGDRLLSVEGAPIGPHDDLDALLLGRAGRRTSLAFAPPEGAVKTVVVRPVSVQVASGLLYRQWVGERRAYVEKISGGRLGYVHIADMSDQSLRQLYIDLDAQNQTKDGVVIDVRNNNGGYINGYALDVFTRRNYLTMTPRGLFPVPSRSALGQRALGLPTVLVTNESSLSDAEDFTEGYRTLGLGKVVGQPTAGWIIYTSGRQLIDGSVVRVPRTRVQDNRGQTMEGHPRPVDVVVERPLGETETGRDAQLEAAVKLLLGK